MRSAANHEPDVSVLITGSFNEYPFALLLEILLHRGETGMLEISSSDDSGYFYVKNGKVKDGCIGKAKGIAALNVVRKFNDGSFRFKPLEPAEFARVIWQRDFGPTGPAIGHVPTHVAVARRMSTAVRSGVAAAYALWRRAEVGTRLRRLWERALAAQERRRRDRELEPRYPSRVSFQLPGVPRAAAITAALHQGVDHKVIFAFTLTILLGISGVMLYQLVFVSPEPANAGFEVDEHFDISPGTTRSATKSKRERKKERTINSSRSKSPAKKPVVPSTHDPLAVPETSPPGAAPLF